MVDGTTAGVAATAAVQEGAKVFLVAPEPYVVEDQCATLRFGDAAATPARIKVIPRETERLEARTESLREIVVGRALYRCGDHQGLGAAILREYRKDLCGLFARHADRLLRSASSASTSGAT